MGMDDGITIWLILLCTLIIICDATIIFFDVYWFSTSGTVSDIALFGL